MTSHPSGLALDRVALGIGDHADVSHVADCAQCQAHVARSRPVDEPLPSWAVAPRWWRRAVPGLLALATVFGALVWVAGPTATSSAEPSVRVKGLPSLALYVAGPGAPRLWNGSDPVSVGSRLQARINGAGFTSLVVGLERAGGWSVLYEGALVPDGETMLPTSWLVDEADASLHLGFLLCASRCGAVDLPRPGLAGPRDEARWWSDFTLSVEAER
jgi:hypothetical protein